MKLCCFVMIKLLKKVLQFFTASDAKKDILLKSKREQQIKKNQGAALSLENSSLDHRRPIWRN